MQAYTYLLINFCTVIICFLFSFHRKIQFHHHFGSFIRAAVLVAIPFIIWDSWFTNRGVWWFNTDYTLGIKLWHLPLEEWLFFICIPFSCVFTYFCLDKFFDLRWAAGLNSVIAFLTIVICGMLALLHYDKLYTFVTAVATTIVMIYLFFVVRAQWIGKASLVFFILMLGFFPVNGVLTGTGLESPIVNYNPSEFLNIRLITIPVEDAVYGYTQFLLVIYFFKLFQKRKESEG